MRQSNAIGNAIPSLNTNALNSFATPACSPTTGDSQTYDCLICETTRPECARGMAARWFSVVVLFFVLSESSAMHDREDCVSRDIRIVDGLSRNITTPSGLRCIPPVKCTDRIDGVVFDGTHPPSGKMRDLVRHHEEKRAAHPDAVFFAYAYEVFSSVWDRKIGHREWMEHMNYAIRYGANADYPTGFRAGYSWPVVSPKVFKKKTQNILYLVSNVRFSFSCTLYSLFLFVCLSACLPGPVLTNAHHTIEP